MCRLRSSDVDAKAFYSLHIRFITLKIKNMYITASNTITGFEKT